MGLRRGGSCLVLLHQHQIFFLGLQLIVLWHQATFMYLFSSSSLQSLQSIVTPLGGFLKTFYSFASAKMKHWRGGIIVYLALRFVCQIGYHGRSHSGRYIFSVLFW